MQWSVMLYSLPHSNCPVTLMNEDWPSIEQRIMVSMSNGWLSLRQSVPLRRRLQYVHALGVYGVVDILHRFYLPPRALCLPSLDWNQRQQMQNGCCCAQSNGRPSSKQRMIPHLNKRTSYCGTSLVYIPVLSRLALHLTAHFVLVGRGRIQLAKNLLEMLPPDLGTLQDPEDQATEYMHYRQFFGVWETFARVTECQTLEQPQMNKETRAAWLNDYKGLIDQAREDTIKLLTTDWLTSELEVNNGELCDHMPSACKLTPTIGDRRRRDLARIRQIYIPELIIRLHSMLVNSRSRIPEFVVGPRGLWCERSSHMCLGTSRTPSPLSTLSPTHGTGCTMISQVKTDAGWEITSVLSGRRCLRVLRVEDRIPSECYLCESAHVFIPLALRQCSRHWLYQHRQRCIGA